MGQIDDVVNTICTAVGSAIETAGVPGSTFILQPKGTTATVAPGQVLPGWPLVTEMVNILAQAPGQWQVTCFPLPAKASTRFSPLNYPFYTPPTLTLTRTIVNGVITFGGSIGTPILNVHTVINGDGDAYVATTANQTLDSLATAVAAAINALALTGVSASAVGPAVTVTGANASLFCNIGGQGTVAYEIARFDRNIQTTVWASDPVTRSLLAEAILTQVGSTLQPFLPLPNGQQLYVTSDGDVLNDDSQSSYSLYISHLNIGVEYPIMATFPVSQLGAVENITTLNDVTPPTDIWVG